MSSFFKYNTVALGVTTLSVFLAVAAIGGYTWMIWYIQDVQTHTAQTHTQVTVIEEKNNQKQTLRKLLRNTQTERAELAETLTSEQDIVSFLESIEALSMITSATVEVSSVEVIKGDVKKNEPQVLKFSVRTKGAFKAVYHTLALLEVFPQPFALHGVRFTQSVTEEGSTWEGDFDYTAHLMP